MKALRFTALQSFAVLLIATAISAQTLPPQARDSQAMSTVAQLLEEGHLTAHQLDDEISRKALDNFVETLDPLKYYFEQADIEAFKARQNDLDDMLRDGDAKFAQDVFRRYIERIDERMGAVEDWLVAEHDFGVDEWLVTDPDATTYAANAEEARERWRKRVKYDLLNLRADGSSDEDARERLGKRYRGFRHRMHRVEGDEVVQMFISAITSTFDPHSTYMGAHALENFEIHMRLDYQGIGALLVEREAEIVIERILPGGPAEKQGGLAAGDQIVSVGQDEDGEMVDVIGMRLRDAVQMIRGKTGSIVRLGIVPKAGGPMHIQSFTRGKTELVEEAAKSEIRNYEVKDGETLQVGVIDLPSFYGTLGARPGDLEARSATNDTRRILEDFEKKGVDVVVLDLRWNGGGYLSEAVDLTGLFIDKGPVVQVKRIDGAVSVLRDRDEGVAWKGPLVILTSKLSASASEIVAAAIKDYGRGLVVGDDTSHGKGTVQRVLPLDEPRSQPQLGALKLTVQKFYRINGASTQLRGVMADVSLPSLTNAASKGEAEFPNALPFDEISPVPFMRYEDIGPTTVDDLRLASVSRRGAVPEFADLESRIAAYERFREQTRVPLKQERFDAFREELAEADRHQPKPDSDLEPALETETEEVADKDDPYMDEVIRIAADYVRLLGEHAIASGQAPSTRGQKKG